MFTVTWMSSNSFAPPSSSIHKILPSWPASSPMLDAKAHNSVKLCKSQSFTTMSFIALTTGNCALNLLHRSSREAINSICGSSKFFARPSTLSICSGSFVEVISSIRWMTADSASIFCKHVVKNFCLGSAMGRSCACSRNVFKIALCSSTTSVLFSMKIAVFSGPGPKYTRFFSTHSCNLTKMTWHRFTIFRTCIPRNAR
mmetsp:Transcript_66237/g.175468  ORF Transcript_66237/g.175468 Transcript_66237/m.175468 type:complete len:200 (+) Transcript_66237:2442-3041(+)